MSVLNTRSGRIIGRSIRRHPAVRERFVWRTSCAGAAGTGATLVVTMLIVVPCLGAALLAACFIVGRFTASATLDQFGWIGCPERATAAGRAAGAALPLADVVLIEHSG